MKPGFWYGFGSGVMALSSLILIFSDGILMSTAAGIMSYILFKKMEESNEISKRNVNRRTS